MLSCYNDFIMSVIKQLLFTATIYAIYAQYMCNIYSVLLSLLSHTHKHVLRKKKIRPSGVVQLERQTNTRDPVRSIMKSQSCGSRPKRWQRGYRKGQMDIF